LFAIARGAVSLYNRNRQAGFGTTLSRWTIVDIFRHTVKPAAFSFSEATI
jgi:hypothetical protein